MSCVISILIRTNYNSNYVIQISFFVMNIEFTLQSESDVLLTISLEKSGILSGRIFK